MSLHICKAHLKQQYQTVLYLTILSASNISEVVQNVQHLAYTVQMLYWNTPAPYNLKTTNNNFYYHYVLTSLAYAKYSLQSCYWSFYICGRQWECHNISFHYIETFRQNRNTKLIIHIVNFHRKNKILDKTGFAKCFKCTSDQLKIMQLFLFSHISCLLEETDFHTCSKRILKTLCTCFEDHFLPRNVKPAYINILEVIFFNYKLLSEKQWCKAKQ